MLVKDKVMAFEEVHSTKGDRYPNPNYSAISLNSTPYSVTTYSKDSRLVSNPQEEQLGGIEQTDAKIRGTRGLRKRKAKKVRKRGRNRRVNS